MMIAPPWGSRRSSTAWANASPIHITPNSVPAMLTVGRPRPPRASTATNATGIVAIATSSTTRSEPNCAASAIPASEANPTTSTGRHRSSSRYSSCIRRRRRRS